MRSTGSRSSVSSSRRENGGYRLARCGGASQKRLLQVGDRTGHAITKGLREAWEAGSGTSFENAPLQSLEPTANGWRAVCGEHTIDAGHDRARAGGRCYAEAQERGELSTNHPNATGEVTRMALDLGAEARDLDALQYHPNGGAWPANMQGYSIPETTRAYGAVLLNAEGEEFTDSLGPRDVVAQAIVDEVAAGQAASRRPTAGLRSISTRPGSRRPTREVSLPYMLRRYRAAGVDPLAEQHSHLPRPPLSERRARDRHRRRDDARGRVRLRRDRRRHPRAQPHDGQQPARVRRLRPAGGESCNRDGQELSR